MQSTVNTRSTGSHRRSLPLFVLPPLAVLLVCMGFLLQPPRLAADPVPVRYSEGLVHGFLVLRTLEGQAIADGDLIQIARGDRVTSKLVFRFRDGSYHEETVVFSQRRQFKLLTNHVVQRGPSFPRPIDFSLNTGSGQVSVRYKDDDGDEKVAEERMELPADLANGFLSILLKNLPPGTTKATLSVVAATPKPRLVKLEITRTGGDLLAIGRSSRKASHFVLKVEIGGLSGLVAPLLGKQPPDNHVWILGGDGPAFVRAEAPLYVGGPSWRIELTSPTWPRTPAASRQR